MDRLAERIDTAERAMLSLQEVLAIKQPSAIERDASIQRFELTFEAVWKAVKQYLYDMEGIDVASPKGVLRACRETGLLTDDQTVEALAMVDDRNMTVHTYNEALAVQIYSRLHRYMNLLHLLLQRMREGQSGRG